MSETASYLTADEAAEQLGIQTASLYAYVSRGLIRSQPDPGNPRTRRYLAEDVSRLQRRQDARRNPALAAEPPLAWGGPVMDSCITLLESHSYYYRGHNVINLATAHTIEQVAGLLWNGDLNQPAELPPLAPADIGMHDAVRSGFLSSRGEHLPTLLALLQRLVAVDFSAYDLRHETTVRQGAAALRHFVSLVSGSRDTDLPLTGELQEHWSPGMPQYSSLLDSALVLCADHELNASSFTVRCIASTRAPLYSALSGGLAALMGAKHGGASLAVEAMIDEVARHGDPHQVLAQRLRRGEHLPGFGHRIYPDGDPRADFMLRQFQRIAADSPETALAIMIADAGLELTGQRPNLELGLVTLGRILNAPRGTALTIMALGRTVGWVAHALEEYRRDELIRPRARYTGPPPIDRSPEAD